MTASNTATKAHEAHAAPSRSGVGPSRNSGRSRDARTRCGTHACRCGGCGARCHARYNRRSRARTRASPALAPHCAKPSSRSSKNAASTASRWATCARAPAGIAARSTTTSATKNACSPPSKTKSSKASAGCSRNSKTSSCANSPHAALRTARFPCSWNSTTTCAKRAPSCTRCSGPGGDARFGMRLREAACGRFVRSLLHERYQNDPSAFTRY